MVAVVGAGYMGGGIAQVLAGAGIDVVIADADADSTQRNHERLLTEARDFEDRKLVDVGFADSVAQHLTWATSLEDAVREVDLIEEAVPEVPALKSEVLQRIEAAPGRTPHRIQHLDAAHRRPFECVPVPRGG